MPETPNAKLKPKFPGQGISSFLLGWPNPTLHETIGIHKRQMLPAKRMPDERREKKAGLYVPTQQRLGLSNMGCQVLATSISGRRQASVSAAWSEEVGEYAPFPGRQPTITVDWCPEYMCKTYIYAYGYVYASACIPFSRIILTPTLHVCSIVVACLHRVFLDAFQRL